LYELFDQHDSTVIGGNLSLEIRNVVSKVPCASDQRVCSSLLIHDSSDALLLEFSIPHQLERLYSSTFLLKELRKTRHAARLYTAYVSMMATASHIEDGFSSFENRRNDSHIREMSAASHRVVSQDDLSVLPICAH
jgi:hypothetical protein